MKQWTAEQIRAFRKRLNLYQRDFAKMLGVTERWIIYLEGGERKPNKTLKLLLDCIEKEKGKEKKHERSL